MRTVLIATLILVCGSARADVIYSTAGGTYNQDFDSLAQAGSDITWTDDTTILGWFSNRDDYDANHGSSTTGGIYSYGSVGESERALGSVASAGNTMQYGLRLQNNTGSTLGSFTLQYDGEQWRRGSANSNTLEFAYATGAGLTLASAFNQVNQLNFDAPQLGPATNLDGNASANREAGISFTVHGISWLQGEQLLLRWSDGDDTGFDQGMAIDNVSFSANIAVPEPSSWMLLLVANAFLFQRQRRDLSAKTGSP